MRNSKRLPFPFSLRPPYRNSAVLLMAGGLAGWLIVHIDNGFLSTGNAAPLVVGQAAAGLQDSETDQAAASQEADERPESISLPLAQWKAAGIEVQAAVKKPFDERIRLTGKVSLNEERISHIYPMVEGSVDEVSVALGDVVGTDELLVIVHSREVGQAKLELFQSRLQLEMAQVKDKLQQELTANTTELLKALREQKDITTVQELFAGRSMGEFRERLLQAYANFVKSQADLDRLEGIGASGAVAGKQLLAARANRNADLATFQARIEQIEYELQTSLLSTSQAVKEADTRVAVATTNLRILGCDEDEIRSVDPIRQGESISHYFIRAPFEGTVISKDVTLREQVRPDTQILTIADLSTVWIKADVYEKDVPLLSSLADAQIRVHNEAWPDRWFDASVFYTGEIMDESTRTVSMRAVAKNPDHLLKPGMFVTIELPTSTSTEFVQVPSAAVQEHQSQRFVFIHLGNGQFQRREVQTGKTDRNWTAITAGLNAGEPVVSSGGFILKSKMLEDLMAEE